MKPAVLVVVAIFTACGTEDDVARSSIFRDRTQREVQQTQASAQTSSEVRTEDELRAAIGNAVEGGNSNGKVIRLTADTITLQAPLVFGPEQTGLTIIGQQTRLYALGAGPVLTNNDDGVIQDVVFEGVRFEVELQSGSNACVDSSATFGPGYEFFRCSFRGALYSVHTTAQSEVSLLLCRDNTGGGALLHNNNARVIGNRMSPTADIVISGGSGGDNAIVGNALIGSDITTSASAGGNTISGNTNVGAITAAGGDNTTGGNT